MKTNQLNEHLKNNIPENSLPWVFSALRQDPLVWNAINRSDFSILFPGLTNLNDWSPANLALIALGTPFNLDSIHESEGFVLPSELKDRAFQALDQFHPGSMPYNLEHAGLLALALYVNISNNSFHELEKIYHKNNPHQWVTPIAILYGLVTEPAIFLQQLILLNNSPDHYQCVLRAFFSNPLPIDEQVGRLHQVLIDVYHRNKINESDLLIFLHTLEKLRPSVAISFSELWVKGNEDILVTIANDRYQPYSVEINDLARHLLPAELHRLGGEKAASRFYFNQSLQQIYELQIKSLHSLSMLDIPEQPLTPSDIISLSPFIAPIPSAEQYTIDPSSIQSTLHALSLSITTKNQSILNPLNDKDESSVLDPFTLYAIAHGAFINDNVDRARIALNHLILELQNETSQSYWKYNIDIAGVTFFERLLQMLIDMEMPDEAVAIGDIAINIQPHNPELYILVGNAMQKEYRFAEAAEMYQFALMLGSRNQSLRSDYAACLEASDDWQTALNERVLLLEQSSQDDLELLVEQLHAVANCAIHAGKPQLAQEVCHQSLKLNPDDGISYSYIGESLLLLDKPAEAQANFLQATQLSPENPTTWLILANYQQRSGQPSLAKETLLAGLQAVPDSTSIVLALGELFLSQKLYTEALEILGKVQLSEPFNREVSINLAEANLHLGHIIEARQLLEKEYHYRPENFKVAYLYAQVMLAVGEPQYALPALTSIITQAKDDDPAPHLLYCKVLLAIYDQTGDPELPPRMIQVLGKINEIDPHHLEAKGLMAVALEASKNPEKAMEAYQSALETYLSQDPQWLTRLSLGMGRVALELGYTDIAICSLQEASSADPKNHHIYIQLCEAYQKANLPDNSLRAARTALNLAINDIDTLCWFADQVIKLYPGGITDTNYLSPNDSPRLVYSEAQNALSQAVQLAPQRVDLLIFLAKLLLISGDSTQARDTLRQVSSHPDATLNELTTAASMLLDIKSSQDAITCLLSAIPMAGDDTSPTLSQLLSRLAHAYKLIDDKDSALATLDRALSLSPNDASLYVTKSDILLENNLPDAALTCLNSGIQNTSISETHIDIYYSASLLLRSKGDIISALNYAEKGVDLASQIEPGHCKQTTVLALHTLVCDLYYATLQIDKAWKYLHQIPLDINTSDPAYLEYICLRADLALAYQEDREALDLITPYQQSHTAHPNLLALLARIAYRQKDYLVAQQILLSALEAYQSRSIIIRDVSFITKPQSTNTCHALIEAALEFGHWDTAIFLVRQAIEIAPSEPLSHLMFAKAIVMRAEYQRLCEALDVCTHAPGVSALSEYSHSSCTAALDMASQYYNQIIRSTHDHEIETLSEDKETPPYIYRWHIRSQAVFNESTPLRDALADLIQFIPNDPETSVRYIDDIAALIATIRRINDNEITSTYLESAIQVAKINLRHPNIILQIALTLSTSQPQEAIRTARIAARLQSPTHDPFVALGRFLLATLTFHTDDLEAALRAIEAALEIWPEEPRWHVLAAEISAQLNNFPLAIDHLEEAVKREPNSTQNYLALGRAYLAGVNTNSMLLVRAVRTFETACQLSPENVEAWMALSNAQLLTGDLDQAAESIEHAISLNPELPDPLLIRAKIEARKGAYAEALRWSQSAIMVMPGNLEAIEFHVNTLVTIGRQSEALGMLDQSIHQVETPLSLELLRADLICDLQGNDAAMGTLIELAKKYPDHPRVNSSLAKIYIGLERSSEAIQYAQKALQNGNNILPPQEAAQIHTLLGHTYRQTGQLDQAVYHLNEAINLVPENLDAYLELGQTYQEKRQYRQALQILQKATSIAPQDPRPHYHAGLALKDGKDYKSAENMLRRAAHLDPGDVNIRRQLAAVVALNLVHNPHTTRISEV